MTCEMSLWKDLIDMKARNNHCVSVLFVLVCLLRELHWNFKVCYLHFFSKFELPNWGLQLIYRCGLYMDVYGN